MAQSANVVPKTADPWSQDQPFRVEHLNKQIGSRAFVYFSDLSSAQAFAAEHTLWNQPCVVQSKDMVVTHRVESFAPTDPHFVFWRKQFGDIASAHAEFEKGKAHASESGGGYRLVEVGLDKPIASYIKMVD